MEEWQYLWNSAEGQHPKDRAFSGAHVASPLPAEETQSAGKRVERKYDHAPGAEELDRPKR